MREGRLSPTHFPAARCETCAEAVLTYLTIAPDGVMVRACVKCDTPIAAPLEWRDAAGLHELGFESEVTPPRRGGCAGGCACGSRRESPPRDSADATVPFYRDR